jgi:hypothetical protein
MIRPVLWLVVVAAIVSGVAAQGPVLPPAKTPPTKSPVRQTERPAIVEGCLRGNRLKIDRRLPNVTTDFLGASEFVLEGPKELLQQIRREHDDHQDEITGIVIIPASRTDDTEVQTTQVGKRTRITIGSRQAKGTDPPELRPLRLKVQSLRHIADKCTIPG